jgi:DNA-binding LytR/AlgR family response regulator
MREPIKCILVDDEEMSRKMVEALVNRLDNWKLIQSCENALQARDFLQKNQVDVLFLDIEMGELSGLDLLKIIKIQPEVIIISSKEKYALDAFEFEVTDYLLKPVALDRFMKAVERVESRLSRDDQNYTTSDSVFVKANNQIMSIKLTDIQWVEAYGDYVNIYTEKDRLVIHSTMKGIESKLPSEQFIRVHRSYIIRIDKINAIDETLIVIGKKLIPIGDSYKAELMNRLKFL